MTENFVLEIRKLNKSFGPTKANVNVDLLLRPGEVRGIAGENGCGKSTLMSILAGMQPKDSGTVLLEGEPYEPASLKDATANGIGMVVQELGLLEQLPGYINMYFGRTHEFTKGGIINLRRLRKTAEQELEKWGLKVNLSVQAGKLSVEERKIIELARALIINPRILILDELTQALSQNNRSQLYRIIEKLKLAGKSVLLVTHDIEEMIRITDSITVMRDGEIVDTVKSAETSADKLKYMMVGRNLGEAFYRSDNKMLCDDEVVLQLRDVCVAHTNIHDVSFELHRGEILALCGLSDSGMHTLGKAVFGMEQLCAGEILADGRRVHSIQSAIRNGIGYVPKDRDLEGLLLGASIRENICLPSIRILRDRAHMLWPSKLDAFAQKTSDDFEIKSTGVRQLVNSLSGGNKQKVNLSRWMSKDLRILVLDSPTRGVDVGVKTYIYQRMLKAKQEGLAILMLSDELPEALGMADRILVMKDGAIVGERQRNGRFDEESIIEVMI